MILSAQKRAGVLLEASVEFIGASFIVRNKNDFDWKDVVLEINSNDSGGGFVSNIQELSAKKSHTTGIKEFARKDGTLFSSLPLAVTSRPQSFTVRCNTQVGSGFWFGGFV